jgi:hypothetical protein
MASQAPSDSVPNAAARTSRVLAGGAEPAGSPGPIPVVLSIDVEPDDFFLDPGRRDPWLGFEQAVTFFDGVRSTLAGHERHPARFTWVVRMDPQVAEVYGRADWAAATYPRLFDTLQAHGDELGVHPHAYRRKGASWTLDYGDAAWTAHCLRSSLESFGDAFGRPCRTIRWGDQWTSQRMVDLLEDHGVAFDLTLEPGLPGGAFGHHGDRVTGTLPDLREAPTWPFHPSADDFRRPDVARGRHLLMIPLSTAYVRPPLWRRVAYRIVKRGTVAPMSTLLLSHEPRLFARIVDEVLHRPHPQHLAMVMRSNAACDGRLRRRITRNLETLGRHPCSAHFVWVPPAAVPAMIEPTPRE